MRLTFKSHNALKTFSSKDGSTTCSCSAPEADIVSWLSTEILSLHFDSGAEGFEGVSRLERGGGETGFEGADGGEVPDIEVPTLGHWSLPDGVVVIDGRCWCVWEALLDVGDILGAPST